ncbi:AAA family ATPase [Kribbella sp. C-35]|uniref:AAA family ATPase n=1 Tax=Kribbella sp. C-35 TaxID=2789276 RepID=UPI00397B1B10
MPDHGAPADIADWDPSPVRDLLMSGSETETAALWPEALPAISELFDPDVWVANHTVNKYGVGAHSNLYNVESQRDFKEWLQRNGVTVEAYAEAVGTIQYVSIQLHLLSLMPQARSNRGWRVRIMGFPSLKLVACGLGSNYQGTQNHNQMGRASALIRSRALEMLTGENKQELERWPSATSADWEERGLMPEPVTHIRDLDISTFDDGQGAKLRMIRNTTVKKEIATFFAVRGETADNFSLVGGDSLAALREIASELGRRDGSINPFADLEDFEAMRLAALDGDEAFQRYRRREAAATRRHVARTVELQLAARIERMVEVAIASSRAVLLVGPPGTGKTEILEQVIDKIDRTPEHFGFSGEGVDAVWVTPEEEWTFEKLVLGETVVDGEIQSVEGDLLQSIRLNQWLVLDETNRADMDRVLGGVLTWLSGKRVRVGVRRLPGKDAVPVYLDWTDQPESEMREVRTPPSIEYAAGSDWRVLGTYNAVDAQRVFRMGQALSRRFKHAPVPPASAEDFQHIVAGHVNTESLLDWFQDRVTRLYSAHLEVADTHLGAGLFVDIPAYIEHGLRMAGPPEGEDANDSAVIAAVGERDDTAETDAALDYVEGLPSSGDRDQILSPEDSQAVLLEELLAEAYVLSAGNMVAKYEPDILDDLGRSIVRMKALTPENWRWVRDNLHAMRA